MTDADGVLDEIRRAAEELVPELTARLEQHGLAEIEVARGPLRLRVAASGPSPAAAPEAEHRGPVAEARTASTPTAAPMEVAVVAGHGQGPTSVGVAAPAVGYFVYAEGLGPGLEVAKGDAVGHVEMLGVRHDVRAPRSGTVRHLVAESGEAVEYGQVVVEIQPAGEAR